jgi:putative acetyltransferase
MSLSIAPVGPQQNDAFRKIWIPWLESTVGLSPEPEDIRAMEDPMAFYGETGGSAFLATTDGEVVGAVAVKGLGTWGFEFCKLVVTDAARGHGAGRALVEACIAYAAGHGGPFLYLQSFRKLEVALRLYARMGFTDAPAPPGMAVLSRTEVIMHKAVNITFPTVARSDADRCRNDCFQEG